MFLVDRRNKNLKLHHFTHHLSEILLGIHISSSKVSNYSIRCGWVYSTGVKHMAQGPKWVCYGFDLFDEFGSKKMHKRHKLEILNKMLFLNHPLGACCVNQSRRSFSSKNKVALM